jgi:hypothetical protein
MIEDCTVDWRVVRFVEILLRRFWISGVARVRWRVVWMLVGADVKFCAIFAGRKEKNGLEVEFVGLVERSAEIASGSSEPAVSADVAVLPAAFTGASPLSAVILGVSSAVFSSELEVDARGDVGVDVGCVANFPISRCAC